VEEYSTARTCPGDHSLPQSRESIGDIPPHHESQDEWSQDSLQRDLAIMCNSVAFIERVRLPILFIFCLLNPGYLQNVKKVKDVVTSLLVRLTRNRA